MKPADNPIRVLYDVAKDHMSANDLQEVGEALTDEAGELAFRAGEVLEGVACLVASDGGQKSKAGNFQDANGVFTLLCLASQQFNLVGALIDVGSEAKWKAADIRSKA